jgi:enediyne biosynthesis protein E4
MVVASACACNPPASTPAGTSGATPGARERFEEAGPASGVDFKMGFLPKEQGETFKINLYDHGCGLAVTDYDLDGDDDVLFLNQLGANGLYRNRGDGTFENVTAAAGVGLEDRICVGAVAGDYDKDGDPDLFITSTRGGNVLFRNEGGGRFSDVTRVAGVGYVGHSQTGAFLDYDRDADLDLFVANTAEWTVNQFDSTDGYYPGKGDAANALGDMARSRPEKNLLYRNNGDGTFTDVSAAAGIGGKGWSGDVAVVDYDEDGYDDLLVTRMFGAAHLFQNRGDGTFRDVARTVLGRSSWGGVGARAFDYNNDGHLDLAILDMHSDMWMGLDREQSLVWAMLGAEKKRYPRVTGPRVEWDPAAGEGEKAAAEAFNVRYEEVVFGNTLYRNEGGGKMREISQTAGFETMWPWGCATADLDSDGYEDAFMPAGMGYPFVYWHNYLMMNDGKGRFADRAELLGVEPPPGGEVLGQVAGKPAVKSSRCAAIADFDRDGRLDLMVNNFNDRPYYFLNRLAKRPWIGFRLKGTRSNPDGFGAVVRVRAGSEVLTRQLQSTGGYLSQSSNTLCFGLGGRKIDAIEVTWPGGERQDVAVPALNSIHVVTQKS